MDDGGRLEDNKMVWMEVAMFRFDLIVDDTTPVFDWLENKIPSDHIIRKIGYKTIIGWRMKIAFSDFNAAEQFHTRWADDFYALQYPKRLQNLKNKTM